jgi:hypothetical protein
MTKENNGTQLRDDLKFLLSFAPAQSPEHVVAGLAPMFYVTLTYEGDVALAARIEEIRNRYAISEEELDDYDDYDEDE